MARIRYDIAQAFKDGKPARNGTGNFRTDGQSIWSYQMLLAHRDRETGELVWDCDPHASVSVTTSTHLSAVRAIMDGINVCPYCGHLVSNGLAHVICDAEAVARTA